jgi:ubiquinone/menaquinone biosynthesis C-methylase UbiE
MATARRARYAPGMESTPSPGRIFDAFTAYQRSAALKAAIELGVFGAIGAAGATLPEIASRCSAAERGVRSLCNRLVADRFLVKEGERYRLGVDAAAFLDPASPAYFGAAITFLTAPAIMSAFASLTEAVRRGGTAMSEHGTLAPEHPVWVDFARAMGPFSRLIAEVLAASLAASGPIRGSVLDVAAGHGQYGITIGRHHPEARIVALDWPNVLQVARENAVAAGIGERFATLPGSAFEVELGSGHALVLLTNFLHHFDPPTNETLLRRVHAALAPGGRAVAVEFVPDEDRVTPPEAASFSLTMLASTPAGDAYTFRELEGMFRAAGFAAVTLLDLAPSPHRAVVAVR